MTFQHPVRVVLDIDRAERTISGRLAVDGAPASGFYGWLELIDELGRVAALVALTGELSDEQGCAP
jgi:hypothetical protein